MKHMRVVHQLADGREKYSTHNGEMEMWGESEIAAMQSNFKRFGCAAYTLDFSQYDVIAKELRRRFPRAKIVRVVGFRLEAHDAPLDPNVIF